MEEIIKKKQSSGWGGRREGAGRPRTRPIKEKPKGKVGGPREGSGRKPMGELARTKHFSFGVSEQAVRRANQLRQMTKQDEMNFVAMLEKWIEDMAKEYGIE